MQKPVVRRLLNILGACIAAVFLGLTRISHYLGRIEVVKTLDSFGFYGMVAPASSVDTLCDECKAATVGRHFSCIDRIKRYTYAVVALDEAQNIVSREYKECAVCNPKLCPLATNKTFHEDESAAFLQVTQSSSSEKPKDLSVLNDTNFSFGTDKFEENELENSRDPVCGGCRHAVVRQDRKGVTTCGILMAEAIRDTNTTLLDAAVRVATDHPNFCGRCRPGACGEGGGVYYRYDNVAPRVERSMTHSLASIPMEHRLPVSAFQDLDEYLSHEENTGQSRTYLFEYNPSIIRLPPDQIPDIPGEKPVYLASYRVTGRNSCLAGTNLEKIWPKSIKDMVGLALLRMDLSIIVDVVVDMAQIGMRVEDGRLFVLNGTVFLTSLAYVVPLRMHYNKTIGQALKPQFPSPLSVVMTRQTVSCITRVGPKNLNYFENELKEPVVEIWPTSPHEVHPVDFTNSSKSCYEAPNYTISDSSPILPSFATVEELHYPAMERNQELFALRDRGTACCIDLVHPESGEKLLVGVSHTKTSWRRKQRFPAKELSSNQFVSRFYAFEPRAPYRVVARSGFFCLGSGTDKELADHPVANYNRKIRSLWIGEQFSCPQIHFVSGMTEKAHDRSRVILAYGINDCSSRFVEVGKDEISRLLFVPFVK